MTLLQRDKLAEVVRRLDIAARAASSFGRDRGHVALEAAIVALSFDIVTLLLADRTALDGDGLDAARGIVAGTVLVAPFWIAAGYAIYRTVVSL